jgi:translation initiation factor IF-3
MIMVLGPTKKKADARAEKAADRARRDDQVAPAPAATPPMTTEAPAAAPAAAPPSTEAPAAEQPA